MRQPCSNCPWWRDATPGYWEPEHFKEIWRNCQDDGLHVMLCHKSTALPTDDRSAHPCQGWLRVLGFQAIGVRLAVMRGHASPDEVQTPAKHNLYSSFSEMMAANGVAEPERNVYVPTPRPRRSSRKRR